MAAAGRVLRTGRGARNAGDARNENACGLVPVRMCGPIGPVVRKGWFRAVALRRAPVRFPLRAIPENLRRPTPLAG
jgi:hypothetical protein